MPTSPNTPITLGSFALCLLALGCRTTPDLESDSQSGTSADASSEDGNDNNNNNDNDGDSESSGDSNPETTDDDTDLGDSGDGSDYALTIVLDPPVDANVTVGPNEYMAVGGELLLEGLEPELLVYVKAPGFAPVQLCPELGGEVTLTRVVKLTPYAPAVELANAAAGGTVSFEGITVTIPEPNSFVDSQGEVVTGPIDVTLTRPDLLANPDASPSCYRGRTDDDEDVNLLSFGMVDVTVWSKEGEELQLAENKSAEIVVPVPTLLAEQSDDLVIPQWREVPGIGWVETGTGVLAQEGEHWFFSFTVDHLSWYNADIAYKGDFECYTIVARDSNNDLVNVGFYSISLSGGLFVDGGWTSTTTTDNEGFNCVIAPLGDDPWLWSPNDPPIFQQITTGTGVHGLCEVNGNPNPDCAVVEIIVPDPDLFPNGDPCGGDGECQSGNCYEIPQCLGGGGRCGECDEDADCGLGGCTPPNPFASPGPGSGSTCNFGQLGAGCESDAACNVAGSTCTTVVTLGGTDFRSCGTCDGNCTVPNETCHPVFDIQSFDGWNSCISVGSLPADNYCKPWPDPGGILACESSMCGTIATACGDIGACGECMTDSNCPVGETCTPGQLLVPPSLSGSQCSP